MRKKIIGIFVCILMISCTTMTFALTPFSSDEQQMKHQFYDTTSVPLPPKRWMKTFEGGIGNSVQQTEDGGYIITGSTQVSFLTNNYNVWLIKTDSNGNAIWNKTFGGTGVDIGSSVQQTTDGGYIITGTSYDIVGNISDVLLIKTNSYGDEEWNKTFGGAQEDAGFCVQQTTDSGYIIAGRTNSFGVDLANVWLIKTDDNGNMIWDWISWKEGSSIGYSVQQTTDGQYIITGEKWSSDTIGNDVLLIKIDVDGNKVWERTFDRKTYRGIKDDRGCSVQQTSDGGYIITGYTDAIFANDVWLIKTNSEGYKVWDRTFGGIGDQFGSSVQQTMDGGYIITGGTGIFRAKNSPYYSYYLYDVWLIKTNRFGIKLWDRTFGGTEVDWGSSVQQTTDGGYIITGSGSTPVSNQQMLLIKTNSQGRSKPISSGNLWFEQLFQRFPNAFPLLRQLME